MAGKREKPEDIVLKLRQVEVLQGQAMLTADAVRQIGTTQQGIVTLTLALHSESFERCTIRG